MNILNGKEIAVKIKSDVQKTVAALKQKGITPGLATVLVGDDPASHVYVAAKIKACRELGINSLHHPLPATATQASVINRIRELNGDPAVHGILLQLPLPAGLSSDACLEAMDPKKDIDALHPHNIGLLQSAKSWREIRDKKLFVPCTPLGMMLMLEHYNLDVAGAQAVVVGRSNLAGKPVAALLLSKNATVTIAHSRTKNIEAVCRQADILVAAIGRPKYVTKEFVKPGAVVLDVGINRTPEGLCGDVDFDAVKDIAGHITPVPGGVGAMTIAMLMYNTALAAEKNT